MSRHLVDVLNRDREIIVTEDTELAFTKVVYGEPNVILEWPLLSVMPITQERQIKSTRIYSIEFVIHLLLYHGEVASQDVITENTHKRAEALETYILSDRKWNFVDKDDSDKDKVIHGHVTILDHPTIILGTEALWSASRLQLEAMSQEVFGGES
jgi:hypothetical protein